MILNIDIERGRLVASQASGASVEAPEFFAGRRERVSVFFLRRTGHRDPVFAPVDMLAGGGSVALALGQIDADFRAGEWILDGHKLPFDAVDSEVQAALGEGVTVSGSMEAGFRVRWVVAGAHTPLGGSGDGLSPVGEVDVFVEGAGDAESTARQVVTVSPRPTASIPALRAGETAVVAEVAQLITGGGADCDLQRITFSPLPASGGYRIAVPRREVAVAAVVGDGECRTVLRHGLSVGQQVVTTPGGEVFFVREVAEDWQGFWLSEEVEGDALAVFSSPLTAVTTLDEETRVLPADASATEVQEALCALAEVGEGGCAVRGTVGDMTVTACGHRAGVVFPRVAIEKLDLVSAPSVVGVIDLADPSVQGIFGRLRDPVQSLEIVAQRGGEITAAASVLCRVRAAVQR